MILNEHRYSFFSRKLQCSEYGQCKVFQTQSKNTCSTSRQTSGMENQNWLLLPNSLQTSVSIIFPSRLDNFLIIQSWLILTGWLQIKIEKISTYNTKILWYSLLISREISSPLLILKEKKKIYPWILLKIQGMQYWLMDWYNYFVFQKSYHCIYGKIELQTKSKQCWISIFQFDIFNLKL